VSTERIKVPPRPAIGREKLLLVRQAAGSGDRGIEVGDGHGISVRAEPALVGGSVNHAPLYTRSGKQTGEDRRMMIAARVLVDLGRAAKLGR
jgi:hypothetical protein